MARYQVLKSFNTPLRRFRVGLGPNRKPVEFDQTELDGPLGVDQLVDGGFIKAVAEGDGQKMPPPHPMQMPMRRVQASEAKASEAKTDEGKADE